MQRYRTPRLPEEVPGKPETVATPSVHHANANQLRAQLGRHIKLDSLWRIGAKPNVGEQLRLDDIPQVAGELADDREHRQRLEKERGERAELLALPPGGES